MSIFIEEETKTERNLKKLPKNRHLINDRAKIWIQVGLTPKIMVFV